MDRFYKIELRCKNTKHLHELIISMRKLDSGWIKLWFGFSIAISSSMDDSKSIDIVLLSEFDMNTIIL